MAATIAPASLKSLLEGKTPFALIDVREAGEYNSSHIPGIDPVNPARNSTTVKSAPTTIGGERLKRTLRPGPENKGTPVALAFLSINQPAIKSEMMASAIQVPSHPRGVR